MRGPTGRIRTTTTIAKAGNGTKDTGTTRITTTITGGSMIEDGDITIMTTRGTSTNRWQES